jgi:hypothetical protein
MILLDLSTVQFKSLQEGTLSDKRYTEKFKVEAIKQITERGHSVFDVIHQQMSRPLCLNGPEWT